MKLRSSTKTRLTAAVGVIALAVMGVVGGAAAQAAPAFDPDATGSLTLYKHVDNPNSTDNNPAGAALEGVKFQIQPITNVDLNTSEGWATIEAAYAPQPNAAPITTGLTFGTAVPMPDTDADGKTTLSGLVVGAYYVTEIGSGDNLITAPAIPFIITIPEPTSTGTWNFDVVAYPKNDVGSVIPTKTVGDPSATLGLGATVDWTIQAPLPQTSVGYDEFSIADNLNAALTFVSWQSVTVGTTPLALNTDYTVDATTHEIELTGPGLVILNGLLTDGPVTVTAVLRTTVNAVGAIPNQANITVNGNTFPTTTPQTNWGALELTKVDSEDDTDFLAGATFDVYLADDYGEPGATPIASGTTNSSGFVSWVFYIGTDPAETSIDVTIVETTAPPGYVLPANPVIGTYTITAGETVAASTTEVTVENRKPTAPLLPLTGSTGTFLYMMIGLGLFTAGGGLLVARRSRAKA